MTKSISEIIKNRPAFHVDEHLKEAAKKAAEVFQREEDELRELNLWKDLRKSGS
jgi:hypothetical protein